MRASVIVMGVLLCACGVQTSEEPLGEGGGHGHGGAGGAATGPKTQGEDVIDAPDKTVYLALGVAPLGPKPADPLGWDLRVSRTMLGTNSGTSGDGSAGAVATEWTSIGDAIVCPDDGYVEDSMLPVPGAPGSGEFSGNQVLTTGTTTTRRPTPSRRKASSIAFAPRRGSTAPFASRTTPPGR